MDNTQWVWITPVPPALNQALLQPPISCGYPGPPAGMLYFYYYTPLQNARPGSRCTRFLHPSSFHLSTMIHTFSTLRAASLAPTDHTASPQIVPLPDTATTARGKITDKRGNFLPSTFPQPLLFLLNKLLYSKLGMIRKLADALTAQKKGSHRYTSVASPETGPGEASVKSAHLLMR